MRSTMFICVCHGISDKRLRDEVACGARRFEDLQARTGVATCCGSCEPYAREIIAESSTCATAHVPVAIAAA
jgi:bacterioferritin-associated ferredoxin